MGIEKIQEFLNIPQTGIWDKKTVESVCELQKKNNKPETGLPSKELKALIESLLKRRIKANKRKQQEIRRPR